MSGSVVDNAATIAAIRGPGSQNKLQDPLDMMTKVQAIKNAQAQNKLIETENQKSQLSMSDSRNLSLVKEALTLAQDPDISHQTPDYYGKRFDQLVAQKRLLPEEADIFKNSIQGMNPDQLRAAMVSHSGIMLSGSELLGSMQPKTDKTDAGGQTVVTSGPSQMQNAYNIGQPPIAPTNLGQIEHTPGAEFKATPRVLHDANGNPVTGTPEQLAVPMPGQPGFVPANGATANPAMPTPPIPPIPGNGSYVAPGSTQTPGQKLGLLANGAVTQNPQAQEAANIDVKNFKTAQAAANDPNTGLATQERNLLRINDELNLVTTGPGTDKVQIARNYLSTLNGLVGGKITQADIDAGRYDELRKDLTNLARNSGMAASSVAQLDAAFHGNPNEVMNRLANLNIVGQLVGANRQQQIAFENTKDPTGKDHQAAKAAAAKLDPVGLAIDTFGGKDGALRLKDYENSLPTQAKKDNFYRSMNIAKEHGWLPKPPEQTPVQVQPPVQQPPPIVPNNMLTNPPGLPPGNFND